MWRDPDTEELLIRKLEAISDFGMFLSQIGETEYDEGSALDATVKAGEQIVKALMEEEE